MLRPLIPVISVLALAACGNGSGEGGTGSQASAQAETPAPVQQTVEETASPAAEESPASAVLSLDSADLANGARQYRRCQSCHTLAEGGRHTIGPNLHGVIGAPAASQSDFAYSPRLRESGLVWDLETLNAWIENPRALVPQNRMSFVGLRNAEDRRDVIAYIAQETGATFDETDE